MAKQLIIIDNNNYDWQYNTFGVRRVVSVVLPGSSSIILNASNGQFMSTVYGMKHLI